MKVLIPQITDDLKDAAEVSYEGTNFLPDERRIEFHRVSDGVFDVKVMDDRGVRQVFRVTVEEREVA